MQEDTKISCTGCADCPLNSKRIGPKGNPRAEFVIVGEGPGVREVSAGVPFMGQSGQIIDQQIPKGIEVFTTTAISCLPPQGKKDLKLMETLTRKCQNRLLEEIGQYPRKVIVALGNSALWALTGDYSLKITQERGKVFPSPLASGGIVAAVHPAFLLRGGGSFKKFQEDFLLALSLYKGEPLRQYVASDPIIVTQDNSDEEGTVSIETLKYFMSYLPVDTLIAADIETGGFDFMKDEVLSLSFCWSPEVSYIIPGKLVHHFQEELESTKYKWCWHNGKFDIKFFRSQYNIRARVDEDTMLMNYTLDEMRGIHDLDSVASDVLGAADHKHIIKPYLKGKNSSYKDIPTPILYKYQALDTGKTLQIAQVLRPRITEDSACEKLYTKTLIPASEFLTHVEMRGIVCDYDAWKANEIRLSAEVKRLNDRLNELAGYPINPNSPAQVSRFLYEDLKIPTRDRSTREEILIKLPKHEAVDTLLEYRTASKALSTYVYGLAKNISDDDRAHSTYLLHGTPTGRLASREPNMQNIPRDKDMRGMFVAPEGYVIISGDENQAELRSLATLSGDEELVAIYTTTGRSLHKEVAIENYGPNYTDDELIRAKAVNFGIIYGRTAFTLAKEFGISVREGQAMIDRWFLRFPKAKLFIDKCRQAGAQGNTIVTLFGRKKRGGLVTEDNVQNVMNEYSNFPHQSIASDLTLHVAMKIEPKLNALGAYIINLIHDDIMSEVPDIPEVIEEVQRIYKWGNDEVAKEWGLTVVPFKIECKVMKRWGHVI